MLAQQLDTYVCEQNNMGEMKLATSPGRFCNCYGYYTGSEVLSTKEEHIQSIYRF